MLEEKLILVTIGPVQSFIGQARKTVDFYAGSKMITKMIEWSYEILEGELGNIEILHPYLKYEGNEKFKCFPNYFLAKAKFDEEKFNDLDEKLREKVYEKLVEYYRKSFHDKYNETILREHIEDCFNIYLIYNDYCDKCYKQNYEDIYKKLNAVKNTRRFKQMNESGRKCSLCGIRNGIFYREKDSIEYLLSKEAIPLNENNKLNENESLCYICFMKRFSGGFENEMRSPSTVKVATLGWVKRKNKNQLDDYNNLIRVLIKDEDIDEKRYYEDWILNKLREKGKCEEKNKIIKKYMQELYKGENDKKDMPTKYYAVIKMDIDDLGKWLSGEYFKDDDLLNQQISLSKILYEFSQKIEHLLEDKGKVVYAGGDDFLFFVTLDNMFEVIKEIENNFEEVQSIDCIKNSNKKITFSTSVVVAHYKTPLSQVLKILNETLNIAKERYKTIVSELECPKNAMAFSYITYSNTLRTTYFKKKNNLEYMRHLIFNLKENLSRKFIYDLEDEISKICDNISYSEMLEVKKIIEVEIRRLIYRSYKDESNVKEEIEKQSNEIRSLLDEYFIEISPNEYVLDIQNYFNFLHICENLSKEIYALGSDFE